ncbi:MAG: discoidin domain-containing protein [Bacteroidota bacterium]
MTVKQLYRKHVFPLPFLRVLGIASLLLIVSFSLSAQTPLRHFKWDQGDNGLNFWGKANNCGGGNQPGSKGNTQGSRVTFGSTEERRFSGSFSVKHWTNANLEETCNQNFTAERAEISSYGPYRDMGVQEGQTLWMGWSEKWTDLDMSHVTTTMQFRSNCGAGSPATQINMASGAILQLMTRTQGQQRRDIGIVKENKWYDWVIEIKYSKGNDGYIKVWRKEVGTNQPFNYANPTAQLNTPTMLPTDNCPHIRWGVYRHQSADKRPGAIRPEDRYVVKFTGPTKMHLGNNLGATGFNIVKPDGSSTPPPLPPPPPPTNTCDAPSNWTGADIGNTGVAGESCEENGVYTLKGAGADIWSTSDQFHFMYRKLKGDGEVSVRMTDLTRADALTKAGLMMRNSLSSSSRHVFLALNVDKVRSFQHRSADGGNTANKSQVFGAFTNSHWIRLVRTGNLISGYFSSNGSSWTLMDELSLPMNEEIFVGLGVNSHDNGSLATGTFDNLHFEVYAPPCQVPADWTASDIGNTGQVGSSCEEAGVITMEGAGADIWSTSDQFHFLYQQLAGNGEISVHMTSLSGADPLSKVGLMMRNTLSPTSQHVFMALNASKTRSLQYRSSSSGSTANKSQAFNAYTTDHWIKLVRNGNVISGYFSPNGTQWTFMDEVQVPMQTSIYVGIGVNSHNASSLATATFGNLQVIQNPACTDIVNLARNKATSQSSIYGNKGPEYAVDGDKRGDNATWTNPNITHTNNDNEAWWEVDLGAVYEIDEVSYWGRTDCCKDRLENAYVMVSNTPFTSNDLQVNLAKSGVESTFVSDYPNNSKTVSFEQVPARYVRIQLLGTNYLSLAEVEVMGCSTPLPGGQTLRLAPTEISSDEGFQETLTLFPNPASERVHLEISSEEMGEFEVVLQDVLGRQLFKKLINKEHRDIAFRFPVSLLSEGLYIITVNGNTYQKSQKFNVTD